MHRTRFRLSSAACLLGALLLAACVTPAPETHESVAAAPAWPSAPAAARIRYLKSVADAHDWGITRSFWQRTIDLLSGRSEERFIRPAAVVEGEGVLFVADPGAAALWILDAPRNRSSRVVEAGGLALVSPVALAMGPAGTVFVVDSELRQVLQLDREGTLLRRTVTSDLARPAGVAFDPASGNLYVVDSGAHRVSVFAADGTPLRNWGHEGGRSGEFNRPTHLALTAGGGVLVNDAMNFRLQAFDRDGRFVVQMGHHGDGTGDFAAPKGIATDSQGHVFVVDAMFDAVQIFEPNGAFLLGFGEHGTNAGQFWLPAGLFIDGQDKIYVADAYNRRVQVFVELDAGAVPPGAKP